jgi:hypothetical protein
MKPIICVLLLLGLLVSTGTLAQEKTELFVRVERVFAEKELGWKVERIYPGNTSDPITQSIVLRSRSGQASVDMSIWRRQQDAEDVFGGESVAFDNTAGKKKVKRSLPGFGDENHIWTNPGSTAWPMIKLRKGSVVVSVFAPSVAIAKKFAQYVLVEIASN